MVAVASRSFSLRTVVTKRLALRAHWHLRVLSPPFLVSVRLQRTMSCPNCVRGVVLPGEPKGVMRSASDLTVDAYLASPKPSAEQWAPSTHAIVLLTDIFGLKLVNSKIMADRFSQELGCDVWVPNLFVRT